MSQENVDSVHRGYDALRRRDGDAFVREMHPEVEGTVYLTQAEGTVYRGHAGVRRYFEELFSVFPVFQPEVVEVSDHGDTLLAEIRLAGRGASSDLPIEQTIWQVLRYRDGKAISFHGYGTRAAALEAAGLAE